MQRLRTDLWRGVTLYAKAGLRVIPNLLVAATGDGGHLPSVSLPAVAPEHKSVGAVPLISVLRVVLLAICRF